MHERATRRLLDLLRADWQYESLEDGLRLLSEFGDAIGAGAASGVPLDVSILARRGFGS